MDSRELKDIINNAAAECKDAVKKAEDERDAKIRKALADWAKDKAQFGLGDQIESFGERIVVDKISGYYGFGFINPCVVYYGRSVTKKGTPRRDGTAMRIYDDGRKITLVKKCETAK